MTFVDILNSAYIFSTSSDYNAVVISFLCIYILPPLLSSSTYVGSSLSCAVIEHIILYPSVIVFLI